jgi:cytidylate kinase
MSAIILTDLSTAIALLAPATPFSSLSPQAAKTLSQAYTQRGALYHLTAKRLKSQSAELRVDGNRKEAKWKPVDFEENASRDFMMGGRYGNEIAKALAVSTNPTAKLCGEMVREAMRKEYAGGIGA